MNVEAGGIKLFQFGVELQKWIKITIYQKIKSKASRKDIKLPIAPTHFAHKSPNSKRARLTNTKRF